VAEKAVPALDRATDAAHRTINKATEAAAPAADWVTENGQQRAARSTELADACSASIRARPLLYVPGALAFGYAAGKFLR
jgi:hypothetical protein